MRIVSEDDSLKGGQCRRRCWRIFNISDRRRSSVDLLNGPFIEPLEDRNVFDATLTTLAVFKLTDGTKPLHLVVDAGGNLFGTTGQPLGSAPDTVFEVPVGSSRIRTLVKFIGENGSSPSGLIIDSAGNLYGTTADGGELSSGIEGGRGTIFEITAANHSFQTLAVFDGTNGFGPRGNLVEDGSGNLYGTTDAGTVFELIAGAGSITTLANFASLSLESAQLVGDQSGNLYGTMDTRGTGSIFKITAGTRVMTTLATSSDDFSGLARDGSGNFYSVVGNNVIQYSSSGNRTTLAKSVGDLTNTTPGLSPDSNGDLFGVALGAGTLKHFGSVWEVAAGTHAVTTVFSFNGSDGSYPVGKLVSDTYGTLYGTSLNASPDPESQAVPDKAIDGGSVFALTGSGFVSGSNARPSLVANPTSQVGASSRNITFSANAGGYPNPSVQWQQSTDGGQTFSDITDNESATTTTLTLEHLRLRQSGRDYRAMFTNSLGSVTSGIASLTVLPPLSLVSAAAASLAILRGSTTSLSALAADPAHVSKLTYTWSVIKAPAGAKHVTFSPNRTAASRKTMAFFQKIGRYTLCCTISDGNGRKLFTDVAVTVLT